MTGYEKQQQLAASVKGLTCTAVELYAPGSWSFAFEGGFGLNVQCPWRILDARGIALGYADDAQRFGLSAPVDGAAVALELLSATHIQDLIVNNFTGDLTLQFESGIGCKFSTAPLDTRVGTAVHLPASK